MKAHFAHNKSECVVTNYEPETDSHIKGKEILYTWIKKNYPDAEVQYEVYIPETKQIADIFVVHSKDRLKGLRWAFEFQHSPLSSKEWEKRHNLYQSVNIQDFWILDKAKFMKFSKAQGITDARLRKDLEKAIYSETGLCYFLDLNTSELTIDFEFTTSTERRLINKVEVKNEYTYHNPVHHSSPIDQVQIKLNDQYKYCVLTYNNIEKRMKSRLIWIVQKLRREQELQEKAKLNECALEKRDFAKSKYGAESVDMIWAFMKANKEELTNDIRDLPKDNFFEKYDEFIQKLQNNLQDFKKLKDSDELVKKLIVKINYESDFYKIQFLTTQSCYSLEEYLINKDQEKIFLVEYVYKTYREVLETISTYNPKYIESKLEKINSSLIPWERNPTAMDYALKYHKLKTKENIDECINKIKENIINHNHLADMDW